MNQTCNIIDNIVSEEFKVDNSVIRIRESRKQPHVLARAFTYLAASVLGMRVMEICTEYNIPRRTYYHSIKCAMTIFEYNSKYRTKWLNVLKKMRESLPGKVPEKNPLGWEDTKI